MDHRRGIEVEARAGRNRSRDCLARERERAFTLRRISMRGPRLTLSAFKTSAKARAIRPLVVICLSSLLLLVGAGILASAAGLAPTLIISTPVQDDRIEDGFFTASGFARGGSDLSARV